MAFLLALSWVPLAMVAKARYAVSEKPPLHLFFDMDDQPKYKPQAPNSLFADGRAMRPPVAGTVARGELQVTPGVVDGRIGEEWIAMLPDGIVLDEQLLKRGQERFDIYCTPCHGLSGYGDGMVSKRAEQLEEPQWVPPSSLHTELVRGREDGHLFNTITNGIRNMPGYGRQISVSDRWAIVAYVRALQRSQAATIEDVPAEIRPSLR
ncbi:MAG: cytochrome c [Acidobacteriota bacterium]|nr:MAG: cytochrome c [Acidobacteriota bacterium]